VSVFTGDANSNGVEDASEFSVIPSSGGVGTDVFFKALDSNT